MAIVCVCYGNVTSYSWNTTVKHKRLMNSNKLKILDQSGVELSSSTLSKDSSPSINEEHIVPSSSSHSSIKTTSTISTAVSGWIDSVPFGSACLWINSLPIMRWFALCRILTIPVVDIVQRGSLKTLQLSLNNSSQGLSQIYEHINRRVPQLVDQLQQLHALSERVATANADLVDDSEVVTSMEHIKSFVQMADMIQASLKLVSSQKQTIVMRC
ncbi:hypothetical protein BCR42DRAFT_388065 [Absidia repens]|uniref:Uncharacterized protein n=1 Tax=Absidia repens TaxID=90262 RepID=A0A1X2IWR1_9FUNG|nr:hypothetical protein BCR42DRAFT_388065 [Absidia repens]